MSENPSERFYRMDAQQLREELFVAVNLLVVARMERDGLRAAAQEALDELGTSIPTLSVVVAVLRSVLKQFPVSISEQQYAEIAKQEKP